MGHDELQEGCDVPVHTAGTRCRRKGNRSLTVSVVDGCIAAIGKDILQPCSRSFTAQVKT